MEGVIDELRSYLRKTLGIQLNLEVWKKKAHLPLFLQNLYVFYKVSLQDKSYVIAIARENIEITPAAIQKHFELLEMKTGMPSIYVSMAIPSYNRQRLIAHRIQFVVPARQIYLPALGVDWLENCRVCQKLHSAVIYLTPSAQAVVIYVLSNYNKHQFIPLELAKSLNYTPMTMTRALNEIESLELGKTIRIGNERQFRFPEDRSLLWQQAKPFMRSPVKKRVWVKLKMQGIKEIERIAVMAGFSALSKRSRLALPSHPVYASSTESWKTLQRSSQVEELPFEEEADMEFEVWRYDPMLFAKEGLIDKFSLYLSLKDNEDERVEAALKHLMKDT